MKTKVSVRPTDKLGLLTGALLAGLLVPVVSVAAAPTNPDFERCGGGIGSNRLREEFTISAARNIWREFPRMKRAPGLEADRQPAHVLVFEDGFNIRAVAVGSGRPLTEPVDTVVCVVQSDGSLSLFTNMSLQGSRLES